MQARHKLSAAFVKSAPAGKHCDGGGLWLVKRKDGGSQWVFRFAWGGRRPEMGLGSLTDVSLKMARQKANEARTLVASGKSPIKERERKQREAARANNTFAFVAHEAFEARKAELKNDGKSARWFSQLELHVIPKIGKLPVEDIDQRDIRDTLAPIWHTKAPTAKKALDKIAIVLKHAAAMGLNADLQAADKAKALLGRQRHVTKSIASLPWKEIPEFYASLAEPTITHLALRLVILTGLRSQPIRYCRLEEIDGDTWTIPPANVKNEDDTQGAPFRVPLSREALRVIELAKPFARDGFLFPSERKGVMSDGTMSKHMETRGLKARPHGFRTTVRTWLAEATDAPHEVAETFIGHKADSVVVRTYRRTDYLEQRRVLAERWADFVTGGTGQVLKLEGQMHANN